MSAATINRTAPIPTVAPMRAPSAHYRVSKPAPLTAKELLLRSVNTAAQMSADAAEVEGRVYAIVAYNPSAGIAYLTRDDGSQGPIYGVRVADATCNCPHFLKRVQKLNAGLMQVGLPATLVCKHPHILADKLVRTPDLLEKAPLPSRLMPELRRRIVTDTVPLRPAGAAGGVK